MRENGQADDPAAISRDAPLRLSKAAEIAYPFDGMRAAGLRREAAKGQSRYRADGW